MALGKDVQARKRGTRDISSLDIRVWIYHGSFLRRLELLQCRVFRCSYARTFSTRWCNVVRVTQNRRLSLGILLWIGTRDVLVIIAVNNNPAFDGCKLATGRVSF